MPSPGLYIRKLFQLFAKQVIILINLKFICSEHDNINVCNAEQDKFGHVELNLSISRINGL